MGFSNLLKTIEALFWMTTHFAEHTVSIKRNIDIVVTEFPVLGPNQQMIIFNPLWVCRGYDFHFWSILEFIESHISCPSHPLPFSPSTGSCFECIFSLPCLPLFWLTLNHSMKGGPFTYVCDPCVKHVVTSGTPHHPLSPYDSSTQHWDIIIKTPLNLTWCCISEPPCFLISVLILHTHLFIIYLTGCSWYFSSLCGPLVLIWTKLLIVILTTHFPYLWCNKMLFKTIYRY